MKTASKVNDDSDGTKSMLDIAGKSQEKIMTRKSVPTLENVTKEMLDSVLTEELTKAVDDAITPSLTKFGTDHPLITIGYKFIVTINDGLASLQCWVGRPNNTKKIRAIRKYREALQVAAAKKAA